MFELLIGILVMAAVVYTGFDILNRIYTRETATDLDKWEADHAEILTSKMMGAWLGRRDKRIEEEIKAAINEKCSKECRVIELVEILEIIDRFLGGYKE
jgi:hypothetical protein